MVHPAPIWEWGVLSPSNSLSVVGGPCTQLVVHVHGDLAMGRCLGSTGSPPASSEKEDNSMSSSVLLVSSRDPRWHLGLQRVVRGGGLEEGASAGPAPTGTSMSCHPGHHAGAASQASFFQSKVESDCGGLILQGPRGLLRRRGVALSTSPWRLGICAGTYVPCSGYGLGQL